MFGKLTESLFGLSLKPGIPTRNSKSECQLKSGTSESELKY